MPNLKLTSRQFEKIHEGRGLPLYFQYDAITIEKVSRHGFKIWFVKDGEVMASLDAPAVLNVGDAVTIESLLGFASVSVST